MLIKIEDLEEQYVGMVVNKVVHNTIYAWVGKNTGKLYGFKIVDLLSGKTRKISFSELDRMYKELKKMGAVEE